MSQPAAVRRPARRVRVPAVITPWFWVAKILTTAMGEATSDWMVRVMGPVPAVLAGFAAFALALGFQLRQRRYRAGSYWLAVAMVAVFGTQAADVLHIKFGLPYAGSVALYGLALAGIFVLWRRTEGTLSIHSIVNSRRELFYWATVLATFALGTAAGDMTATTLHFGYLASGVMFGVVIAVPAVAFRYKVVGSVASFWFAYVVTRPLGASFADYMCKPKSVSGIDLGDGWVALGLTAALAVVVGVLASTRMDLPATRVASSS